MSETARSLAITHALESFQNVRVERTPAGLWRVKGGYVRGLSAGTPDKLVMVRQSHPSQPRYVWLEVKTPERRSNPKTKEAQERWRAWAAEWGVENYVVEDPQDALQALGLVKP